jgi:hypothetical protein
MWEMVDSLGADRLFWSRLEGPFRRLLVQLGAASDQAGRDGELARWFDRTLRATALGAFAETADQLDRAARTLRAAVLAEGQLRRSLAKVARQHRVPTPEPEGAEA